MPRNSLTMTQRQALRAQHRAHPTWRQAALSKWFAEQYNQVIGQSTVSECLSDKYAYLDRDGVQVDQDSRRRRKQKLPELEAALITWYRAEMMVNLGHPPSGEELQSKARELWEQYGHQWAPGGETPAFSAGWMYKFKRRFGVLPRPRRKRQWDANGVEIEDGGEEDDGDDDATGIETDAEREDSDAGDEDGDVETTALEHAPPEQRLQRETQRSVPSVETAAPTPTQALHHLRQLRIHEEQAEDCDFRTLLALDQMEQVIRKRHLAALERRFSAR